MFNTRKKITQKITLIYIKKLYSILLSNINLKDYISVILSNIYFLFVSK